MKKLVIVIVMLFVCIASYGQQLYVRTFGNAQSLPIIFLHGGPGYNSSAFEATTAQKLADAGYFVIVYDRRGEGRSEVQNTQFTFAEAAQDIDSLYTAYHLTKATLMAHSFGGVIATEYAKLHPEKINVLLLVSAPTNLQKTFKNIIDRSAEMYKAKADTANLKYIAMLGKMDTASLMYSSYAFMHAMQNGFYNTKAPTEEAKSVYNSYRSDSLVKYGSQMTQTAPIGFWKNEHYTTLDLTADLQQLKKSGMKLYAIYGKEDGLYSPPQIADAKTILGEQNVLYFNNASHNVFMDQQTMFIKAIKNWVK